MVRPSAAKTPHREAERARRGAINRPPVQIPRAKPKKISATIQNGAFFSSLLMFTYAKRLMFLHEGRKARGAIFVVGSYFKDLAV